MDAAADKPKEVAGRVSGDQDLVNEGKVQHASGTMPGTMQGVVGDAGKRVEDALGSMGKKLAANRRKKAGERPERSRRELDREF